MHSILLLFCSPPPLQVPIPQYPLYSASISLYGGKLLPYQLNEARGWGLDLDALTQQVQAARQEGYSIR
jgi:alanine transaminase